MTWTRQLRLVTAAACGLLLVAGCGGDKADTDTASNTPATQNTNRSPVPAGSVAGVVTETMDSGGYTYVQVKTGDELIWAAAPEFKVEVGENVMVPTEMPMKGYHSEPLDRTFDLVYFAQAIKQTGQGAGHPVTSSSGAGSSDNPHGRAMTPAPDVDFSDLTKAAGGMSVGEVFAGRGDLAGKEVVVRGKVVKFSSAIMGTNWIHIQDGTGSPGENDLTVTSQATVELGSTVLVRGVAAVDKDFGAGYKYSVILEKAEVIVE